MDVARCETCFGINRIRLEFKDSQPLRRVDTGRVLIESDWNLKNISSISQELRISINRIRLEFKVCRTLVKAAL